jgi:hypothetical protein
MSSSWFNQLGGMLQQYAAGTPPQAEHVEQHFDQVASSAPQASIAEALAAAMRSNQTPPFGEMLATMFSHSNPDQKAGLLNTLLGSVSGGGASSILSSLGLPNLGGTTVTAADAQRISPADVQTAASEAEQRNPSVVDRASEFYSQHPLVVKMLGAAALSTLMSHMAERKL